MRFMPQGVQEHPVTLLGEPLEAYRNAFQDQQKWAALSSRTSPGTPSAAGRTQRRYVIVRSPTPSMCPSRWSPGSTRPTPFGVAGSTLPPVGTIASAREQLAMRTNASSVLVIGSGTSGQRAAIAVHQAGADVLMIAKRPRRLYPPQDIGRPEHVHSASAPTGSPPANQVLHP
jgi:FAD binding domain